MGLFWECLAILGVLEQLLLQLLNGCALCRVGIACLVECLQSGAKLNANDHSNLHILGNLVENAPLLLVPTKLSINMVVSRSNYWIQ